jgi:hypothetical protein
LRSATSGVSRPSRCLTAASSSSQARHRRFIVRPFTMPAQQEHAPKAEPVDAIPDELGPILRTPHDPG